MSFLCHFLLYGGLMDNQDESLVALLESNEPVDETTVIILIGILSDRGYLGPDTIGGKPIKKMNIRDDKRAAAAIKRRRTVRTRAFEVIKQSHWYAENRWPTPLDLLVIRMIPDRQGFSDWVDRQIQNELEILAENEDFD